MRTYEALYIVSPEVEDDNIQTITQEVEALVTQSGGSIVRSEIWGKRKLAYEVKKFTEGNYVLLRFQADQSALPKIESFFKLSETVIRNQILHFDEHTLRLEAEQAARKEAEIAQGGGGDRDYDSPRGRHGDDDDDGRPRRGRRDDDDDDDDDDRPRRSRRHDRNDRDDDD